MPPSTCRLYPSHLLTLRNGNQSGPADVLCWVLTEATDEGSIEHAVKAVAGIKRSPAVRSALADSTKTLCRRFEDCFEDRFGMSIKTVDVNRAQIYLYALLRLVPSDSPNDDLYSLIGRGKPLDRWDDLHPALHALAFSLRIYIVMAQQNNQFDNNWPRTKESLIKMTKAGLRPHLRRIVLEAITDGLDVKGKNRPTLAKTRIMAMKQFIGDSQSIGYSLANVPNHSLVAMSKSKAVDIVTLLVSGMLDGDEEVRKASVEVLLKLANNHGFENAMQSMIELLKNDDLETRETALGAITKLASTGESVGCVFACVSNAPTAKCQHQLPGAVQPVLDLFRNDESVRHAALDAITQLATVG